MVWQEEPNTIQSRNPFNLSNDEYYNPKLTTDNALRTNLGVSLIQVDIKLTLLLVTSLKMCCLAHV